MREKRMLEGLVEAISATMGSTGGRDAILSEALHGVRAMLSREDRGWELLEGGRDLDDGGLTLEDLKAWSLKLREDTVGAPWIKRGFSLRSSYIWQGGIQYEGVPSESRGRGVNVQEKIDDPINQRSFFGKQARRRREGALYYDGIALWIGDDNTKILEAIPLSKITGILRDPDHEDIIYAYRREWNQRQPDGTSKAMKRWYYVDTYKKLAVKEIRIEGSQDPEIVDLSKTAFDMHANSFSGWALGSPDALAAWYWNKTANGLYMDGVDVSEAMASIIYTATTPTAGAGTNAAVQYASPQAAGSTAVIGGGSAIGALSTAGRGYDFSAVREVISMIASALDVSNIHLTSNPGDAGSSYGSAQSLDLPTKLAMQARRDEHIDLDLRVLRWMAGETAAKNIKVYFNSLDDGAEVYRHLQAVTLPWLQGVIGDDVYKELVSDILGVPTLGPTPDGMLLPNNKDSLPRRDIDKDGATTGSTANPTQGQSSGLNDSTSAPRDARTDA